MRVVLDHEAVITNDIDSTIKEAAERRAREGGGVPSKQLTHIERGMYVIVKIIGAQGHTLRGTPVSATSLESSSKLHL